MVLKCRRNSVRYVPAPLARALLTRARFTNNSFFFSQRVKSYIDIGKKEGATLLHGGVGVEGEGFFIEPTVFANVTPEMKITQEEIFGPGKSLCHRLLIEWC